MTKREMKKTVNAIIKTVDTDKLAVLFGTTDKMYCLRRLGELVQSLISEAGDLDLHDCYVRDADTLLEFAILFAAHERMLGVRKDEWKPRVAIVSGETNRGKT